MNIQGLTNNTKFAMTPNHEELQPPSQTAPSALSLILFNTSNELEEANRKIKILTRKLHSAGSQNEALTRELHSARSQNEALKDLLQRDFKPTFTFQGRSTSKLYESMKNDLTPTYEVIARSDPDTEKFDAIMERNRETMKRCGFPETKSQHVNETMEDGHERFSRIMRRDADIQEKAKATLLQLEKQSVLSFISRIISEIRNQIYRVGSFIYQKFVPSNYS